MCFAAALFLLMMGLSGCGSDDTGSASAASCDFDNDCELGTVCNFEDKCVAVPCENCENNPNQICLVTDEHPNGVCSRPECNFNEDCDAEAGETCNDGVCTSGGGGECQGPSDCEAGETCNLAGECVPDEGPECTDSTDCATGETCNANNECVEDTGCTPGSCPSGQTCNTDSGQCEDDSTGCTPGSCPTGQTCNTGSGQCEDDSTGCTPGSCPSGQTCNTDSGQCEAEQTQDCDPACTGGQICDTTTGTCIDNNCPVGSPTPSDCASDPVYNKFDADGCFCAQCLSDNDCDTAAGETCNPNGECIVCNESCDPADGGNACSDPGFYCVSNCCVECIGNTDCPSDQVCVDGSCGAPPDCSVDPSICTGGTVCQNGQCVPPSTGGSCQSNADCQTGQFCDPTTQQCQGSTGPGGSGCDPNATMCNPDCTCPAPSTCELGMLCAGCTTIPQAGCPDGQLCLFGVCF